MESISKYHKHEWQENGNYLTCSICNKNILNLKKSKTDGILVGKKVNGTNYTVRTDRKRYFFPHEWIAFLNEFKHPKSKTHRFFFLACLHTGGRIMEVLNLRYSDIDVNRSTVNFSVTKNRAAKKNVYAIGKSRNFFVASNFIKEYKSYIRGVNHKPSDYIFLNNDKLPSNYSDLPNAERKKHYSAKAVAYSSMLKRKLLKAGIEDYKNFSPHNIRKTYGMWMKVVGIEFGEMCYRLGHDMDTYLAHYGSSLIFTENERHQIRKILGDTK